MSMIIIINWLKLLILTLNTITQLDFEIFQKSIFRGLKKIQSSKFYILQNISKLPLRFF